MPTIFDIFGLRGFFYSGDHNPIHIHVVKGDGEVVINIGDTISVREINGMSNKDVKNAVKLVETFKDEIIETWNRYHN